MPTLPGSRGWRTRGAFVSVSWMRISRGTLRKLAGTDLGSCRAIFLTPRATDWGLAALVSIGLATGGLTLYAGAGSDAWVFAVHAAAGLALAGLVTWKLRRVWPRLRDARLRDRHSRIGIAAL